MTDCSGPVTEAAAPRSVAPVTSPHRPPRRVSLAALLLLLSATGCGTGGGDADGGGDSGGGSGDTNLSISSQPESVKAELGAAVSLSVTAAGTGALSYQWYKGGAALPGATGAAYAIGALSAADAGRYLVVVADGSGTLASDTATVTPTSGGAPVDVYDLGDGFNPADEIDNVTFAYTVTLDGTTVSSSGFTSAETASGVTTLTDAAGKTVVVNTAASPITVVSTVTSGSVNYVLTGTFATGLKLTSSAQVGIALGGVTISSSVGPAISVNGAVRAFVALTGDNTLTESSPASTAAGAALYGKGALLVSGTGTLAVTAGADYATHAIKAKDHVRLSGGTVTLKTRYNPATKTGGTAALIAGTDTAKVYGISAGGAFVMDGGTLGIASADELSSGSFKGWGRGIGVGGVDDTSSANAWVVDGDGAVSQVRTGFIVVNGGTLAIRTYDKAMTAKYKCYGATYTTSAGTYADYDGDGACTTPATATSTAPADPDPFVTINGGTITIRTTGTPCDPTETMGASATCTGTSPGVSPEGIEAKSVLTINGGTLDIEATDDALNAGISVGNTNYPTRYGNAIVVNGGYVHAASSDNDGMDSNAVASPGLTVNGGVVIASGVGAPEEGFDVDPYAVAFNGGTAIGTGGGNSSVYSGSAQDHASVPSIQAGKTLAIWKGSGSAAALVFAYQVPSGSGGAALSALVSSAGLVAGGTYAYAHVTASTITCSEWFHGLCVGTMSASLPAAGTSALTVR
jgi:trimeric autotransporter adhesin